MQDLEKFANLALPVIFGTDGEESMLNFYGLNCVAVRNDLIEADFLSDMYRCYEWDLGPHGKGIINAKNYKYKKGVPSLLPMIVLRLLQFLKIPNKLKLFKRDINIEEELEFKQRVDFSEYKTCLNSDLTIIIGTTLIKNPRIQELALVNLNLYDIDIQTLVNNVSNLSSLRKLSFKRSTFMDRIKFLERILDSKEIPSLTELNLNMTNILTQLMNPTEFFNAL